MRDADTHQATWSELTTYEQGEARFRGFPMEARFIVRRRYNQEAGELALVRFERIK